MFITDVDYMIGLTKNQLIILIYFAKRLKYFNVKSNRRFLRLKRIVYADCFVKEKLLYFA
jgi:hypothetical protein